jgi:hypothetical protein
MRACEYLSKSSTRELDLIAGTVGGILSINEYILQRQNTVVGYASSRPIYKQCIHSEPVVKI